jgi:glutathione S-transferase
MIRVHHLNNSRSQRVLWCLEEIGLDYEIVPYQRDATTNLAPPELKAVHPLGKSPVIEDAGQVIAESGVIIYYLAQTYGEGLVPPAATPAYWRYQQWLHFAEGSAMLPFMLRLYTSRLGEAAAPLKPRIRSEIANHLGFMEAELGAQDWFMGDAISAADFQLSFVVEIAKTNRMLDDYPGLAAWLGRAQERAAYRRALEKGGAYAFG